MDLKSTNRLQSLAQKTDPKLTSLDKGLFRSTLL